MFALVIAFAFSYIGSIPPGTINISVLQLSFQQKRKDAFFFSLAAAFIEFPYAFIAVEFSEWLLNSSMVLTHIKILSITVLFILAILNIYGSFNSKLKISKPDHTLAFKKGLIISILNPLAIPFWVAITSFSINSKWIDLFYYSEKVLYCLGVSLGTFVLLCTLVLISQKIKIEYISPKYAKLIPGIIFLVLGIYACFDLILK